MKIAVCISGQTRSWNQVKDNIIQNVLKEDADVFFVSDEDLLISNINHEIIETLSFYDEPTLELFNSRKNNATIIENCSNMFYKIMRCNQLKIEHENKHNFKYDIVVRLRTDVVFQKPLIFSEDRDKIFIPHNCYCGGLCDQFAYGPSDLMDKFCNLFTNIKECFEIAPEFHPEKLLKAHCDNFGLNIIRQDVGMSILR